MRPVYETNDDDEHLQHVSRSDLQQQFIDRVRKSLLSDGELRTVQS